ncbi:MAG: O-antigen ligase family protein [Candidatus Omnitrophica bacterium]|nr:O-antigen ligase family protein [Candidatus Omnitrophota bacterium]
MSKDKLQTSIVELSWKVLLGLVFLRPLISEHAYLKTGFWLAQGILFVCAIYLIFSARPVFPRTPLNKPIILFLFAIVLSVVFSVNRLWSAIELYWFMPNILIFYIAAKAGPKQQNLLIATIVAAAGLISIYALYQYFFVFKYLLANLSQIAPDKYTLDFLGKRRILATFISPNIFASFQMMMFFVLIGFLLNRPQKKVFSALIGVIALMMVAALLLTRSLGATIVFISCLFMLFFIFLPHAQLSIDQRRVFRRIKQVIVAGLIILVLISAFFLRERLSMAFNLENSQNPIVQRLYYWRASLGAVKDYTFTGTGWRSFGLVYEKYKPAQANISHYSHSLPLQIMVETGPLGLISLIWFVLVFLRQGLSRIKVANEELCLYICLFCGACAFLLHNIIDLSFYFTQASFYWWVVLGLLSRKASS